MPVLRRNQFAQSAEVGLGAGDVVEDLSLEGGGIGEPALVADAAEEFYRDALRGNAGEGGQEKSFDGQVVAVESGAEADVGDGRPIAGDVRVAGAGDIDARLGKDFGLCVEIQCRSEERRVG